MTPSDSVPPRLSIIIPHYNDVDRLITGLEALVPQLEGQPVETVVVDNNSTHDISHVIAAYPQIRFLVETEKGVAAARNRGVAETTAPGLLFIDSDCVAQAGWIEAALNLTGPDEIFGGHVGVFDETPPPRSGAQAFETVFAFRMELYITKKNFTGAGNMLTTRVVFDDTGPFDGTVVEDSDWCQRAVARGWKLTYRPEMSALHPTRTDWTALERKWKRITAENYFAYGTDLKGRLRWAARSIAVLGSALLHIPKVLGHPALTGQERVRALGTLFRLRVCRTIWMLRQSLFGERPLNT